MWLNHTEFKICDNPQSGWKEMTDTNHMVCYAHRLSRDRKRKGRIIILIYLENPFPDNLEHGALRTTTFLAATGVTAHWEVHIVNIVHLWTWHTQILAAHTGVRSHWEVHTVNIVHLWIWHTKMTHTNPCSTHWGEKALRSTHCEHCSFVNMTHKNDTHKSLQHTLGWEVTEKYTLWTLFIQEYDANEITHPKILTAYTAVTTNWEVHTENITHWEHCKFRNVTPVKLQTKNLTSTHDFLQCKIQVSIIWTLIKDQERSHSNISYH